MKLISISGLDGSGKSTQIELLKKYLESQGKNVFYFHAIQFSFARKLTDFMKKIRHPEPVEGSPASTTSNINMEHSVTYANWFQLQLRKIFLLIDVLRFKCFAKKANFDYILSDRYFYDSAINIKYLSLRCHSERNEESLNSEANSATRSFANTQDDMILKFAESLIPSPEIKIFLDAEPAIIMQRKRVPDQGIEYLKSKKDLFEKNIEKYGLIRIQGNGATEDIFEKIKSNLNI